MSNIQTPQMGPYIIDTSSLINLRTFYPKDIFPPVWARIEDLIRSGSVILCSEIVDEIKDDDLVEFIKPYKHMIIKPSADVQKKVKDVLSQFKGLIDIKKMGSGDPFIISYAMLNTWIVVTDEKHPENPKKIPHVCNHYKVPYLDLIGLLRQTGFRLV